MGPSDCVDILQSKCRFRVGAVEEEGRPDSFHHRRSTVGLRLSTAFGIADESAETILILEAAASSRQ